MMRILVALMLLVPAALTAQTAAPAVALQVADKAPPFKLHASDGKTYSLEDFKGKQPIVLAWFPKAFTEGCTLECKSLAEHGDLLKKFNARYFMISVDPLEGEKGNKAFAEAHNADFPLLSDPTMEVAKAYGVLNARNMANRWTFYIGADGKILAIDKQVKPATSAEDMAAKLTELGVAEKAK
jgi:thioredoxin-dependent peroxiredoxin